MPLLGYGGYLPFALEVFAAWSFMSGLMGPRRAGWPRFAVLPEAARGKQPSSC
jgi:hypothetical protein